MVLECVNKDYYESIMKKSIVVYDLPCFHELNKNKVDYVVYMLFRSKKYKAGVIAGVTGNVLKIPYSAPFSMIEPIGKSLSIEELEQVILLIDDYCKQKKIKKIQLRTPPFFYGESYLSKLQNCLLRNNYKIEVCDLNYQYFLVGKEYLESKLKRNAKKNLKNAMKYKWELVHCDSVSDKKKAYEVIAVNRKNKGYPLRMTWEQVQATIQILEHDFFLLKLDDINVAAAVIFRVTDSVYQVIYWGDIDGYDEKRPMNYLSYYLYLYYLDKNIKVLDIGPSTEDGIPNYGLCSFKESIGCEVSCKYTYVKEISD